MEEKVIQITLQEKQELERQLEELILVKKPEVIERIKIARSYGDLSENSEYDAAKDEQRHIYTEIERLEALLRTVEVIDLDLIDEDLVSIGKTIKVLMGDTGEIETYHISGNTNVNIFESKVSLEAPFGQAIANKKVNDTSTVHAPNGDYEVKILDIYKTVKK